MRKRRSDQGERAQTLPPNAASEPRSPYRERPRNQGIDTWGQNQYQQGGQNSPLGSMAWPHAIDEPENWESERDGIRKSMSRPGGSY